MNPRVRMPDIASSANTQSNLGSVKDFLANYSQGPYRELGLKVIKTSSGAIVNLKPVTSIDQEPAYIINIKGRVHVIPSTNVNSAGSWWRLDCNVGTGWDPLLNIGYRIDSTTPAEDDRLLIWAFADDKNENFLGFGLTKYPMSSFTGVSSGTPGATGSFTGLTNARSFTPGALVRVRTSTQWNYGVINSITSNTAMTINLYPTQTELLNTTISTTTDGVIIQLDKFFPWNSRTDTSTVSDLLYKTNYRLVGEIQLDGTTRVDCARTADDPSFRFPPGFVRSQMSEVTVTAAGTTNTDIPLGRYFPPWASTLNTLITRVRGNWTYTAIVRDTYNDGSYQILQDITSFGTTIDRAVFQIEQNYILKSTLTVASGTGNTSLNVGIAGYMDGGITEL